MLPSRRAFLIAAALGLSLGACRKSKRERVYVSAEEGGFIAVIDPENGALVERIPVGKRPRGMKLSADGSRLYVALSGSPRAGPGVDESQLPPADRSADGIGVVSLTDHKLLATYPSGQDPECFDLGHDGNSLYISNEETAELSRLDLAQRKIARTVLVGGEPEGVTVRPDGKVVYVTSEAEGIVAAVDVKTFSVLSRIPTGARPRAIVFTSDGATGFVSNELGSSLTLFDTKTHAVTGTLEIPAPDASAPSRPMGLVLSPDGKRLYASTGRGKSVAVIDVAAKQLVKSIPDVGTRPWGIGISPDGKRLYTANGPSNDVSVIDLATHQVTRRIQIGGLPWGVVVGLG
jgi:YVTN family beta-propeller protein